jgi:putative transposase
VRCEFLKLHRGAINVKEGCRILNISRSEYYDYLQRPKSNRSLENEALAEEISDIFYEHHGRYGCKRIQKVLEKRHISVNHKRIARIMRQQNLRAKGARKNYRFFPNKTRYEARDNVLNRVFTTQYKNQVWVGDITYVPTARGFLYLSVFIDIFSRKVVGWSMDTTLRHPLPRQHLFRLVGENIQKEDYWFIPIRAANTHLDHLLHCWNNMVVYTA